MSGNPEIELVFHEALTSLDAPAFCRTVRESLATTPGHLWINLEDVKVADIAGPAALLQAVKLCHTRGVRVSILPSPMIYRALLTAGIPAELPPAGPCPGPSMPLPGPAPRAPRAQPPPVPAATPRRALRPPARDGLGVF